MAVVLIGIVLAPIGHQWSGHLFEGGHHHAHEGEVVCNELTDKDPCHRKLVHHDIEEGCNHDAHISEKESSCSLCSIAPLRHDGLKNYQTVIGLFKPAVTFELGRTDERCLSTLPSINGTRGPPSSFSFSAS